MLIAKALLKRIHDALHEFSLSLIIIPPPKELALELLFRKVVIITCLKFKEFLVIF